MIQIGVFVQRRIRAWQAISYYKLSHVLQNCDGNRVQSDAEQRNSSVFAAPTPSAPVLNASEISLTTFEPDAAFHHCPV